MEEEGCYTNKECCNSKLRTTHTIHICLLPCSHVSSNAVIIAVNHKHYQGNLRGYDALLPSVAAEHDRERLRRDVHLAEALQALFTLFLLG